MKEGDVIWHWRTWQKRLRAWRWDNLVSQSFYSDTVVPIFGWFLTVSLIVGLFRTIHNVPAREESVKIPVDRLVKVPGLSRNGEVDSRAVAESVSRSAFDPGYGEVQDGKVSDEVEAWRSQSKPLRNREQRRGGGLESEAKTGKKKSRKKKKMTGSRKDLRKKKGKGSFSEDSESGDDERVERESAFSRLAKTEFAESLPRSDEDETFSTLPEVAGDSSTVTGLEESEAGFSGFESQEAESQAARSRGKNKRRSRTGLLQFDASLLGQGSQLTLKESRKREKKSGRSNFSSAGSSTGADPAELSTVTEHKTDWELPSGGEGDGVRTSWLESQVDKKAAGRRKRKRGARNLSS